MRTVLDPILIAMTKAGIAVVAVNYRAFAITLNGEESKLVNVITTQLGYSLSSSNYYRKGQEVVSLTKLSDNRFLVQYNTP